MPSIFTLEGHRLDLGLANTQPVTEIVEVTRPTLKHRLVHHGLLFALGIGLSAAIYAIANRSKDKSRGKALKGPKRSKGKFTVFEHEIDRDTGSTTRIRQSIDTTTPGDYGADPIGPNDAGVFMFRMVPSGDVVDGEERNRRLNARKSGLRGSSMLKLIASESRSPQEFARRAEAWNAAEAQPLPVTKLARAYTKAKPGTVARLIREAEEQRREGREKLWTKMSRGLRGNELGALPADVAKIAKKLNAKMDQMRESTRDALYKTMDPDSGVSFEDYERLKAERDAFDDEIDKLLAPLTHPKPKKAAIDAVRAYGKANGLKGRGLAGYRVAYGMSDSQGTFRLFDDHTFETIEGATKRMRFHKRRGFWTWVEDEQGNFVPVPGAKSERVRASYPLRTRKG
jgi:hypothetical protein